MGCWNGTCMISHLPIMEGDKVKLVVLYGHKKEGILANGGYCYPSDILSPAFLPIEGVYNDYGGIEDIKKDWNYNVITKFIKEKFKSIKLDDEEIKDFTLENILEGIGRGNLSIYQELDKERVKMAKETIKIYEKNGGFGSKKVEKEWRDIANTDASEQWRDSDLSFVMIRADVWDELCTGYVGQFYNEESKSVDDKDFYLTAKESCKRKFEKTLKLYKSILPISKSQLIKYNEVFYPCYCGSQHLLASEEYGKYMFKKNSNKEDILKQWTETVIIDSVLSETRRGWMIQPGAGSQCTGYEEHLRICKIIEKICKNEIEEQNL